jgi:hypothetical protein
LIEELPTMTVGPDPGPDERDDRYMKWVHIESNRALRSIDGLPSAPSIEGSLIVRDNEALEDLAGLESLQVVGGVYEDSEYTVWIEGNRALRDLNALNPEIDGSFEGHLAGTSVIRNNPALPQCEIDGFLEAIYSVPVEEISSWIVEGNGGGTCP